jgi:4-amino-4-deoxy-L-arabinose transferase-like glycosyltransferase
MEYLFPLPSADMDQFTALKEAVRIYHGHYIHKSYMLSPAYTLILALFVLISGGKLIFIRILQISIAALIPVFIYKLSRHLRINFKASQAAAFLYCFYGPAILISMSLLRASLLALCFLLLTYFLILGFKRKKSYYFIISGVFAGLTILGRENFIPVIFMPLLFLFSQYFRNMKNIKKFIALYIIASISILLPCLLYNYFNYGSFAIIPGNLNNVISCYHGQGLENLQNKDYFQKFMINIPHQFMKFILSYEIPNSLSFYAHKEIIPALQLMFITFNAIIISALIGVYLNFKNKGVQLIALLICSYIGTMLYFEMFYRFRIPVVPLLFVLTATAIHKFTYLKKKEQFYILSLSIILFFITYRTPEKLMLKNEKISIATVLVNNNHLMRAESYMDKLLKQSIFPEKLWLKLSSKYYQNGNIQASTRILNKYKQQINDKNTRKVKQ